METLNDLRSLAVNHFRKLIEHVDEMCEEFPNLILISLMTTNAVFKIRNGKFLELDFLLPFSNFSL